MRRSPPSSLRLVQGPAPSRATPKHTLPSVPRPTFHPPSLVSRGPAPRARQGNDLHAQLQSLSPLVIPIAPAASFMPESPYSRSSASSKVMRGPWDHSGSIQTPIDVGTILTPLKPVALNDGVGWAI